MKNQEQSLSDAQHSQASLTRASSVRATSPFDTYKRLGNQLEGIRDVSELYGTATGKEVLRELQKLAKLDLPGAVRLWKDHASDELRSNPTVTPSIIRLGELIESRFEGRSRSELQNPHERDAIIARAQPGRTYDGQIIGRTPEFAVMAQSNGDVILHRQHNLSIDVTELRGPVRIDYQTQLGDLGIAKQLQGVPLQLSADQAALEASNAKAAQQFSQSEHATRTGLGAAGKALEAAGDDSLATSRGLASQNISPAEPGRTYEGPVQELSSGRIVQRTSDGRLISHKKQALAGMRLQSGQSVQIRYNAGSRIGLVSEAGIKPTLSHETSMQQQHQQQHQKAFER